MAALSLGCGGGGGDGSVTGATQTTPGTLVVTASPTTAAVTAGGMTSSHTITVTRGGSFTGAVTLAVSGAPANVAASFDVASVAAGATSATLTLAAARTAAAGTYPLSITASGTGVASTTATVTAIVAAAPTPAFAFTLGASTLSVVAGANGSVPITVTRSGGFTGPVAFAVTGAPLGVTAAIAPASATGDTARLTVSVPSGTAATTAPVTLTIRGTGTGAADVTQTVALTITAPAVTGGFTLAVSPASLTLAQGQTTTATVTIARTGGFAGPVDLTVGGLPSGVTATVTPIVSASRQTVGRLGTRSVTPSVTPSGAAAVVVPATSSTATIVLTATASAAAAPFTLTLSGSAAGLATQTTTTTPVTIVPPSSAGPYLQFCGSVGTLIPFVAVQDGTGSAWRVVAPDAGQQSLGTVYRLALTQTRGALAYVTGYAASGYTLSVIYGVPSDFSAPTLSTCSTTTTPRTRSISGTVAGLTGTLTAAVGAGVFTKSVSANAPTFTFTGLPDAPVDVLAVRYAAPSARDAGSGSPDRLLFARGVTGSTVGTLDLAGPTSFAPDQARLRVSGVASDERFSLIELFEANFQSTTPPSPAGISQLPFYDTTLLSGGEVIYYGVPAARQNAGDLHLLTLDASTTAISGSTLLSESHGAAFNVRVAVDRSVALGPRLATETVADLATAPYRRVSVTLPRQAEYGASVEFALVGATSRNSVTLTMNQAYSASGPWTLTVPNFSGLPGWLDAYGPQAGAASTTLLYVTGSQSAEGVVLSASRTSASVTLSTGARPASVAPRFPRLYGSRPPVSLLLGAPR